MEFRLTRIRVSAAVVIIALAGCQAAESSPSESDAQAVWHHVAAQNHLDGVRELGSLRKTDGQVSKVQGTTIYTLSYEAKVRYLTPVGKWKVGDVQTVDSNYGFREPKRGGKAPMDDLLQMNDLTEF